MEELEKDKQPQPGREADETNGEKAAVNPVEESVLQFLAEEHPDDETALEELSKILTGAESVADRRVIELVYKGSRYEKDLESARKSGYVAGRNEKIELEKQIIAETLPVDDGGLPETADSDLPLLRHIRRSVWDD